MCSGSESIRDIGAASIVMNFVALHISALMKPFHSLTLIKL